MYIGIITNKEKDPALAYTSQICEFLQGQGVICRTEDSLENNETFWVILGGDGTMLHHSHRAAMHGIPLLGINLGNLGFLTDVEKQDGIGAVKKALAGEYQTEKRLMLAIQYDGTESEPDGLALNDVYIGTNGGLKTFSVYVNGNFMDKIRADGIIVATPTGSTAYNLSAGGPILVPNGKMMVITPVCPHSLNTRPVVVSAEDTVQITAHQNAPVFIDGERKDDIAAEASITVQKSPRYATILKTAPAHLHAVLRRKKIL